ncbi:putative bicyclomycin resistance protein [Botrytis fragariae]|uniref:Putative bicyclomycin resistance protein n=1 Tax=Botrytis fragariae TaxID=1964551 RepID=A0A8H6AY76_9HELO|nr:putative bicyclomycin resistance protein [Botrytis fragariae]KAF5875766.1 putative bicyclomycin resistance protein [Botrytis fragariae]
MDERKSSQATSFSDELNEIQQPQCCLRWERLSYAPQRPRGTSIILKDDENARNWPPVIKYAISISVLYTAFAATFGNSTYTGGMPGVITSFGISKTIATFPISCYSAGLGIGALFSTAFSEVFGRRVVYRVTAPLALIFTLLGGCAANFATIAIARTLAGLFASPCLTVGGGIISDVWNISLEKTGTTFAALFVLFVVGGTQTGPMVSAAIIRNHSWRWEFWVSAILFSGSTILAYLLPETYQPQISRRKEEVRMGLITSRATLIRLVLTSLGRPLHMLLVEPTVFPTGLVMAITQSVVFSYLVSYANLFEKIYQHSPYEVGMAFCPLIIGSVTALPTIAIFDRLFYRKPRNEAIRTGTKVAPEKRLYPAMLGSITLPISLFWLAWTGRADIPSIIPILSGGLFGFSFVLTMLCLPVYHSDFYTAHYSASMLAALTFMRFFVSACFPLITPTILDKLGFTWATSMLGFITVSLIPIPWILYRFGPYLRTKSQYIQA